MFGAIVRRFDRDEALALQGLLSTPSTRNEVVPVDLIGQAKVELVLVWAGISTTGDHQHLLDPDHTSDLSKALR